MAKGNILIIDDEVKMGTILKKALNKDWSNVEAFSDSQAGIEYCSKNPVDIVITDLKMPKVDGIEVLKRVKELDNKIEVIMMTAYATAQSAIEAMKAGAYDYIIKPFSIDELKMIVQHIMEKKLLEQENLQLRDEVQVKYKMENIIAESGAMQEVIRKAQKVSKSNATVLLLGESGTGKEVLARAIHKNSLRAKMPLIKVDCGAIPEGLLESELFGHIRGSFTGAIEDKIGQFELADKGTMFLDEIGELSQNLQVKLLRVLQEGEIQIVGGKYPKKVDVRIIAATNKNLEECVKDGTFRQDLYYRLSVVPIYIPPLRERKADIPALVEYFLKKYSYGKTPKNLAPGIIDLFIRYDWDGNIRELENAIEHSVVMSEKEMVEIEDLPLPLQSLSISICSPNSSIKEMSFRTCFGISSEQKQEMLNQVQHDNMKKIPGYNLGERSASSVSQLLQDITSGKIPINFGAIPLEDLEKLSIIQALKKTNNNQTKAAKLLGITRRTLGYRIKKYDIKI